MDLSEVKRFEAIEYPRKLKLSEAIRAGIPFVKQKGRNSFQCCALGAAYFAVTGQLFDAALMLDAGLANPIRAIALVGGWDYDLCRNVSGAHANGVLTRKQCANLAEGLGN